MLCVILYIYIYTHTHICYSSIKDISPHKKKKIQVFQDWVPRLGQSLQGRWQGEFLASSLERRDSGQGKLSLPRLNTDAQWPKGVHQSRWKGRGAPIRACQALCSVPLCTCPHSSPTWAPGGWGWGTWVRTASPCQLSTAGETEAQLPATPNPSSQPPRAARRPAAAHCTGAAITPGPRISVTSRKTRRDQTGNRDPRLGPVSAFSWHDLLHAAGEMFMPLTRHAVN